MPGGYQLLLNGQPAETDLYTSIASLEVEESMDLPAAVQIDGADRRDSRAATCFTSPTAGSRRWPTWPWWRRRAAVARRRGRGMALSARRRRHTVANASSTDTSCRTSSTSRPGIDNSTLSVWGQDASWLMNLTEKVKEWVDVTDADVANAIFGDYGITPSDQNTWPTIRRPTPRTGTA